MRSLIRSSAAARAENDAAAVEFAQLLVQSLDVPEVAEALARALLPQFVKMQRQSTAARANPPVVTARGQRKKPGKEPASRFGR